MYVYICKYIYVYAYICKYIYIYGTPPPRRKSPPFSLYNLILGNQREGTIYIYTHVYACAQLNDYSVFMFVCMKV